MLTTNQKEQLFSKLNQLMTTIKVEQERNSVIINNKRFEFPKQEVRRNLSTSTILSR